jgi:two-component system, cell cycle sensor histidine kinase and response regulator CckA
MSEPIVRDGDRPSGDSDSPRDSPHDGPAGSDAVIHVLLVDDDDALRGVLTRGLRGKGFEVVAAGDAEEALRLASSPDVKIDVIVMDLVLPDSWGSQLAMEQSIFRPDAKIIFISGYSGDDVVLQATASREIRFLAKPFTVRELAALIRRVMAEE